MDVLRLVLEGHDELRSRLELLMELACTEPQETAPVIRRLIESFAAQHEAEERVLFARLLEFDDVRSVIDESWEEHAAIDLYLQRMKLSHSCVRWPAKMAVLRDLVELHMAREENRVLPVVIERLGDGLETLGVEFEEEKERRLAIPLLA